jgi:hypothetical protein
MAQIGWLSPQVLLKRLAQRKERVLQAGTARLVANACQTSNVPGE